MADDAAGLENGESQVSADLGQETSRRAKAGPLIRRAVRGCSYMPPKESGCFDPVVTTTGGSTTRRVSQLARSETSGGRTCKTSFHESAGTCCATLSLDARGPQTNVRVRPVPGPFGFGRSVAALTDTTVGEIALRPATSTGCTSGRRTRPHGQAPMAYRERIRGRAGAVKPKVEPGNRASEHRTLRGAACLARSARRRARIRRET
jgi:hypothetical protein